MVGSRNISGKRRGETSPRSVHEPEGVQQAEPEDEAVAATTGKPRHRTSAGSAAPCRLMTSPNGK